MRKDLAAKDIVISPGAGAGAAAGGGLFPPAADFLSLSSPYQAAVAV